VMVTNHRNDASAIFGERMSNTAAAKDYGVGRRCSEGGCQVLLSRYNSTEWCAHHESGYFARRNPPLPGTDPAPSLPMAS